MPRLRALRELVEDAGYRLARGLRRSLGAIPASGRAARRLWFGRSLAFRRRFAAVILVLALYAVFRFLALPGVPCGVSPAEECPPSDDAIALVAEPAYAYAHLNLDPDSSQVEQAQELVARFPHAAAIAQGLLRALGPGASLDLGIDVLTWLGTEAAAAEVPAAGGAPEPLLLLAIDDRAGSRAFVAKLGGRQREEDEYRGVDVSVRGSVASAELEGFLALGSLDAVRSAVDVASGEQQSLADSERADAARGSLPAERLADLYVSEDGIDRLLAERGGLAEQLDTFTDYDASEGISASLRAEGAGLELELASDLDPEAAKSAPSFFSAFPSFRPALAGAFPTDTLMLLAVGDPSRTVTQLLEQADAAFPGITESFDRLNATLAEEGGVDIEEQLLPLLTGEAAVGVSPGRPLPYVTAVFDDVDEAKAREAVARLQAPLIEAFDPARTGQAPSFSSRRVDGVRVFSVDFSPALELSYAVFDGRLVVGTDSAGVEQAIADGGSLAEDDAYRAVRTGAPSEVSALLFLNLEGLVRLAEPRGLAEIVSGFRQDLGKLEALGLTVRSDSDSLQTRIFLNIE